MSLSCLVANDTFLRGCAKNPYQEFLETIQDVEHPEHEAMLEWVGGFFDPEEAELGEINAQLKMIPK